MNGKLSKYGMDTRLKGIYMKFSSVILLAILPSLLLTGCNDDAPADDSDILAIEDLVEFSLGDYTQVSSSDSLAGVWVAVGAGTFVQTDVNDAKFGQQVAEIYFVIQGSEGNYEYANCFDTGTIEGDYDRGGFESLTVLNSSIVFDSVLDNVDSDDDGNDDRLYEDVDRNYFNTGVVSNNSSITSEFVFDDGESREVNSFEMIKVSETIDDFLGTAKFIVPGETAGNDKLACFAQWVGSYDTNDGLYQVHKYDASFEDAVHPYTFSDYDSDEDDNKEYTIIDYGSTFSRSTLNDDEMNDPVYFMNNLDSYVTENGSTVRYDSRLTVVHAAVNGSAADL